MKAFNQHFEKQEAITKNKLKQTIPHSGLAPYGTIPKYSVTMSHKLEEQQSSVMTPYPFFQSPSIKPPSFLSTLVQSWFSMGRKLVDEPMHLLVGFMPPSVSVVSLDLVSFSSIKAISNPPLPMLCDTLWDSDRSKSENVKIPYQKQHDQPSHDYSSTTCSYYYSTSKTTSTLSELLCEHYVHQQLMMTDDTLTDDDDSPMICPSLSPTSTTSSESTLDSAFSCTSDSDDSPPNEPVYNKESPKETGVDVPLATFRTFREIDKEPFDKDDDCNATFGKEVLLENSWVLWQEACLTKQWILSRPKEGQVSSQPLVSKGREPRVNSAHLRMLVAEVNMMRADKIVGPLRPRNYLPKRTDPLRSPPSPLSVA